MYAIRSYYVVQERKGEHEHVLENLRTQGYVRARIDGNVISLDETPKLKRHFKHTVEAVVDRVLVRPGQEQRLAESFETALHLSDGLVRVVTMSEDDQIRQEQVFSARYSYNFV